MFCNGVETCDPTLGCQDEADPCQAGETCNDETDTCESGGGGGCQCLDPASWAAAGQPDLSGTFSDVITTNVFCGTSVDEEFLRLDGVGNSIFVDKGQTPHAPPYNPVTYGGTTPPSCGVIDGEGIFILGELSLTAEQADTCFQQVKTETCVSGGAGN